MVALVGTIRMLLVLPCICTTCVCTCIVVGIVSKTVFVLTLQFFTDVHVHIIWQSSCVGVGVSKSQALAAAALNSDTPGSQDLLRSLEKVVSSQLAGFLLSCEAAKAGNFW